MQVLENEVTAGRDTTATYYWLGYTCLALNQKDRAVENFERYLRDDARNEDVLYALARTYAELSQMSLEQIFQLAPKSARSYHMRGIRFELEESWREAIAQFETAVNLDNKIMGSYAAMGRIYAEELKDSAHALTAYKAELDRDPGNRAANEWLGKYYANRNQPAIARRYRDVLRPRQLSGDDRRDGTALLQSHRAADSLPYLLRWRKTQPRNVDAYYYLGEAFTDMKVNTIDRLKAVNPHSYRLHQLLAESYVSIHRSAEAITEYRKVLEMESSVPGVRYELARLLLDTEVESAIPLLTKELEFDPDHYLARALLGRVYVVLHDPDKAIPLLDKALEQRPDLLDARKALGQAWAAKQQYGRALELYKVIAEQDGTDEQIHFLLAEAWRGLGKPEEAAREMQLHRQVLKQLSGSSQ